MLTLEQLDRFEEAARAALRSNDGEVGYYDQPDGEELLELVQAARDHYKLCAACGELRGLHRASAKCHGFEPQ